jgi:hypothetical protein
VFAVGRKTLAIVSDHPVPGVEIVSAAQILDAPVTVIRVAVPHDDHGVLRVLWDDTS